MTARFVDVVWTDLLGRSHLDRLSARHVADGMPLPAALAGAGYGGPGAHTGELRLVVEHSTVRDSPFDDRGALGFGSLVGEDGSPSSLCTRSALAAVLERVAAAGFHLEAAAELEFFLVDPGTKTPLWADINQYSVTKGGELEPLLGAIRRTLLDCGVRVEAMNPEYSGGQVELNIRHAPAMQAAEMAVLARHVIRRIARATGLDATFLAKPWTDQAGSGLHVHQSLWQGSNNAMYSPGGLSPLAESYVAGQLAHLRELALLGSPNPNAYHRRADMSFAPTTICWGFDNRTVAVRAIVGSEGATRIEQRDASADCNVYLAFAGQFASGLDGVTRGLVPPAPAVGNAYELKDAERVPETFVDALAAFSASSFACNVLGETAGLLLEALAPERELAILTSADWERDRYFSAI